MDNRVLDYTFTIIDDGKVPLAGFFGVFDYLPVYAAVIIMLLAVALGAYIAWSVGHTKRVAALGGDVSMGNLYIFHPRRLLRREEELEYEAAELELDA